MPRVVLAPDSMGGLLSAADVAHALEAGWRSLRPDDDVASVPMSDGGEGLLEVLHRPDDRRIEVEVAGPLGHPVTAAFGLRPDGTAIVESAAACGLALAAPDRRDPMRATTWGVGQLLDAARTAGAARVLLGLGGSATVDGGAGALSGLGMRVTVADGSGLKVGAADLARVAAVATGWRDPAWGQLPVELLADVDAPLADAATRFAPQKGASPEQVEQLAAGLAAWQHVVERDLDAVGLAARPGTGAAGGLAFGLAAALAARLVPGARRVAELVGLDDRLGDVDLVVTGEGRLDATSFAGKVVGEVVARARARGRAVAVVAGDVVGTPPDGLEVVRARARTPAEARVAVAAAGRALAEPWRAP